MARERARRSDLDPILYKYVDNVSNVFADSLADVGFHWQFVSAVSKSHERTPKRVSIDLPTYLYQATSSEEVGGLPDDLNRRDS
jgi:hypothetical protein